ncbi:hypothetical protein K9M18_04030 [Candidatus Woesearchaeota archaeon]|nr:hypothetical protein [Candidatus Woesearchaeota archaeon]MCF8013581.1 hypothetical protein [Candidatus Woesearchaeota archaeon]
MTEHKIPEVKEKSKDEIIEVLREELRKKDKQISRLKEENQLLLKASIRKAKRELEEKDID